MKHSNEIKLDIIYVNFKMFLSYQAISFNHMYYLNLVFNDLFLIHSIFRYDQK